MEVADVRRRAALRGQEAEAQSRINVGVWTARLFAVNTALSAIALASVGESKRAVTMLIVASGIATASVRIERGNRVEASLLTGLFIAGAVLSLFVRDLGVTEIAIRIAGAIGMSVGLRGVLGLYRVRESYKAELIDPVETRKSLL